MPGRATTRARRDERRTATRAERVRAAREGEGTAGRGTRDVGARRTRTSAGRTRKDPIASDSCIHSFAFILIHSSPFARTRGCRVKRRR